MSKSTGHPVTLKDIAREVGVSAMTVSRALSDKHELVNAETVRRVREVAEKMGYKPNLLARSLRGEQLPTIVVFAEFISAHQYLAELSDFCTRAIEARGYSVITCQSRQSLLNVLSQFNLAGGVILAPPESLFIDKSGKPANAVPTNVPLVVIHSAVEQHFLNEVSPDLEEGVYQATQHLVKLGHRRIGFLGGAEVDDEPHWFQSRQQGIHRALGEVELRHDSLHYQPCCDRQSAPEAVKALLKEPRVTGIICLNDELAIAAIHAARKMGLETPRDISVIGSNDIEIARYFSPAVTTLSINVRELVDAGLNLLFDDIANQRSGPPASPVRQKMECRLVTRESTAPAPSEKR